MVPNWFSRSILAVVVATAATAAVADDTGLAYMHDMRKEGGRLCMSDHWHFGSGTGRTRKSAEVDAIKSWVDFTVLEYGTAWGRFSRAAGRSIKCMPGSSGYDCQIDARPCK